MREEPRMVRKKSDLAGFEGQEAIAAGRYRAIPRPVKGSRQSELADRAVLELADGSSLYLEALDSPRSRRSPEEIERFNGKKVRVKGIAYAIMPSAGQGLLAPCISDIEEIREE